MFGHLEEAGLGVEESRCICIQVANDDFGTGCPCLCYLTRPPLDFLKVDKTFVDTIGTDPLTREAIEHTISLAKSLKFKMIAEGGETPEQVTFLRQHWVQPAQGWQFARLMLVAELAEPYQTKELA